MKNTIKKMIKAIAGICALAAVFAMSDNTGGTALAMSVVAARHPRERTERVLPIALHRFRYPWSFVPIPHMVS